MSDTKTRIFRGPNGWYDADNPNTSYNVRWKARLARKAAKQNGGADTTVTHPDGVTTTNATIIGFTNTGGNLGVASTVVLDPLQEKLYDRWTDDGVMTIPDMVAALHYPSWGYNQKASYGHMRKAGANAAEARIVIDLGRPTTSYHYGKFRELSGYSHTTALTLALEQDQGD